jgi:hypothetical protein
MNREEALEYKQCAACGERKTASQFLRRTGKKSGPNSRRGTCKPCMRRRSKPLPVAAPVVVMPAPVPAPLEVPPVQASSLLPTRQGVIRMRGRTDKGRRWHQEIDLALAETLVRERAAVLVNGHTIRRLYSNKDFRRYILTRDKHTCHYCGQYGDTLDHLLPRAKGGHTTPDNCVCACMECNQSKADRDLAEFMGAAQRG